jgi:hypothetical protein
VNTSEISIIIITYEEQLVKLSAIWQVDSQQVPSSRSFATAFAELTKNHVLLAAGEANVHTGIEQLESASRPSGKPPGAAQESFSLRGKLSCLRRLVSELPNDRSHLKTG